MMLDGWVISGQVSRLMGDKEMGGGQMDVFKSEYLEFRVQFNAFTSTAP